MTTRQILDFFRNNDCLISMHENRNGLIFSIWSKKNQIYILTDANEYQLNQFYTNINK